MSDLQRYEFKFLITARQRDEVFAVFNSALKPDANGSNGGVYPIVSLYYDTNDWRCYWEAWRGMPSRRKLRVRVYGTTDGDIVPTSFVEVKHKLDGLGVKRRVHTSLAHALEICRGEGDADSYLPAEARTVREVHRLVQQDGFRPVCTMRYLRHAFALHLEDKPEPMRLTFDHELAARFRDLHPEPDDRRCDQLLLPADHLIMEVKGTGAVPAHIAACLAKIGLSSRSFSKYGQAVRLGKLTLD